MQMLESLPSAFHQLKNIRGSSEFGITTKIRVFNTIVKPILLYGAVTWRTTTVHEENPGFHQHLLKEDPEDLVARKDQQ